MLSWRKWVRKTAGRWAMNVKADRRRMPKSIRRVEALEVRALLSADLGYAKRIGNNTSVETAVAMTADAAGNQYFVGVFSLTVDFDPGVGTVNLTSEGSLDNFVTKFDPTGNLVWARRFGSVNLDSIKAVDVDSAGNVYTTGTFLGLVDFDPGDGFALLDGGIVGSGTAFVSKLNSDGNFVWVNVFGQNASPSAITTDNSGNVYTVGTFLMNTDFDPGAGAFNLVHHGGGLNVPDAFVSKLDSDGSFVWARGLGGTGSDSATAVAVDGSGSVVVGGTFSGTSDFNPGVGTFNLVSTGSSDGFATTLDSDGSFVWAKRLGGIGIDAVRGIALDSTGSVLLTGHFGVTADFDPGVAVFNLTSQGAFDAFVVKLRSDGSFVWAKAAAAGNMVQVSVGIAVDAIGNIYTSGIFEGTTDFDPAATTFTLTSAGATDSYLSKLNSSGEFVWARKLGGAGQDFVIGIALDAAGKVLTAGSFIGTSDFDPGPVNFPLVSAGSNSDLFVAKYVQTPFFTIPSDGEPHDLTLRLNGTSVELFDNVAESVVASALLADLIDVPIVGGSGEQDDSLTVDYSFGGLFRLPGGIHFDGGSESFGDRLTIIGNENQVQKALGEYFPSGTTYGAGSFRVAAFVLERITDLCSGIRSVGSSSAIRLG